MAYETPKMALADMQGCYVGSTPARRWYDGDTLVFQAFSPASEQEFIQQEATGGPAQLLKVYGKSIVWNQLIGSAQLTSGAVTRVDVTFTPSGEIYIVNGTANADASTFTLYARFKQANGHKYYCKMIGLPSTTYLAASNHGGFAGHIDAGGIIVSCTQDGNNQTFSLYGLSQGMTFSNKKMRLIIHDLTLLYGAGNEPTTAAQFEADYPEYDPTYDPGSLQSNKTAELRAYDGGTLRGSLALNLSTLTSGGVVVFPDGLRGVGTDRDAVYGSTGEVARAVVDLGTLTWYYNSSAVVFYAIVTGKKVGYYNILCSKYVTISSGQGTGTSVPEGHISGGGSSAYIYIKDTAYTDAATFKAAMSGVMLDYPLATPQTYTLDTPLPTDLTCVQGDILQRVSDNNCPFVGEMKFGL